MGGGGGGGEGEKKKGGGGRIYLLFSFKKNDKKKKCDHLNFFFCYSLFCYYGFYVSRATVADKRDKLEERRFMILNLFNIKKK